jgi:hypothetical protein
VIDRSRFPGPSGNRGAPPGRLIHVRRPPTPVPNALVTVVITALVAALAACGDDETSVSSGAGGTAGSTTTIGHETRYEATTTVLESTDHGPQLCLGGVAESYPPQCGGPDVLGWDWNDVEGEESASGTTWGSYRVVGTWDGEALALTEPPSPPEGPGPGADELPPGSTSLPPSEPPAVAPDELDDIRAEVEEELGEFLYSWVDEVAGHLVIGVVVDGGLQQRLDDRYGTGVVVVQPQLQPVET